jgi:uncharacterized protein
VNLQGSTAVVTGASSGIGAATARALAAKGARVLLLARTRSALDEVATGITARGGEAVVFPVDLSNPEAIGRVGVEIRESHGVPDLLVNNAGSGRWLSVPETTPEELHMMTALPYFAAFLMTRAFLPHMIRRGSGHIVNLNSPVAFTPWADATGYASARWAMRGFSKALQADLRGTGVRVTEVVPTTVRSNYFENNPGVQERLPGVSRLYGVLEPEDVARALVRGVERNRTRVVIPVLLRMTLWVHRIVPGPIEWMVHRTSRRASPGEAS